MSSSMFTKVLKRKPKESSTNTEEIKARTISSKPGRSPTTSLESESSKASSKSRSRKMPVKVKSDRDLYDDLVKEADAKLDLSLESLTEGRPKSPGHTGHERSQKFVFHGDMLDGSDSDEDLEFFDDIVVTPISSTPSEPTNSSEAPPAPASWDPRSPRSISDPRSPRKISPKQKVGSINNATTVSSKVATSPVKPKAVRSPRPRQDAV